MPSEDHKASNCRTRPNGMSAKEREDGQASWRQAGLELPADACFDWVSCKKPPLHWEPLYSTNPVELRLANMTAALDAGADPNELDHELYIRRCLGRPLHRCIGGLNVVITSDVQQAYIIAGVAKNLLLGPRVQLPGGRRVETPCSGFDVECIFP